MLDLLRMTEAQINALEAGSEIDALVAKYIFGKILVERKKLVSILFLDDKGNACPIEKYSSDIGVAWKIIHAMKARGFSYSISSYLHPNQTEVCFNSSDFRAVGVGKDEPMTICRAALLLMRNILNREAAK